MLRKARPAPRTSIALTHPILDDFFHACALSAFLEEARAAGTWPDSEAVRRRAYDLYEAGLREKNRR